MSQNKSVTGDPDPPGTKATINDSDSSDVQAYEQPLVGDPDPPGKTSQSIVGDPDPPGTK